MNIKILVLPLFVATLLGCASTVELTKADIERRAVNQQVIDANQAHQLCLNQLETNSDYKLALNQIIVESELAENRFELFNKKVKITSAQKKSLQIYLTEVTKCTQVHLTALSGSPYLNPYESYYAALDRVHANLLGSQMTIGLANERKLALIEMRQKQYAQITGALADMFNQARSQELRTREASSQANRARWAAAMQSMSNSFGNTAQYYQNQNQQLQQNNQYQYRAPTNTSCQPNGVGGFNCTTR
jgi:hypothetical protein